MPIRIPRTSLDSAPATEVAPRSGIVPFQPIGNPAEAPAQVANQAAGLAAQIMREDRDREIVTRLTEVDVERRRSDTAILDTYSQLRGKNAVENRSAVLLQLEQNAKRIRSGIKDHEVARLWELQDGRITMQSMVNADRHYRQENLQWQAETLDERAQMLAETIDRSAFGEGYDPATGTLSIEADSNRSAYRDTIRERGELLGWSSERITNEQRRADTKALGTLVERLALQERPSEAAKVLERYGEQIDPLTRDKLASMVRRVSVDQEGQNLAYNLQEQVPDDVLRQIAELDRLNQQGAITIDVRDNAAARLNAMDRERYQQRMRSSAEVMSRAEQMATANGWTSLTDVPQDLKQQLEETGNSLRLDLFLQQGGQWKTTEEGARALMIASVQPEWLQQYPTPEDVIERYRTELSSDALRHMVALWGQATKKNVPPGFDKDRMRLRTTFALQERGLLPDPRTDDPPSASQTMRAERIIEAVRTLGESMAGSKDVPQAIFEKALDEVMGREIRTAAGEKTVEAGLLEIERPFAGYKTSRGTITKKELEAAALNRNVVDFQVRMRENQGREATAQEIAEFVAMDNEQLEIQYGREFRARLEADKEALRRKSEEEWARVNKARAEEEHRWKRGEGSIFPVPMFPVPIWWRE